MLDRFLATPPSMETISAPHALHDPFDQLADACAAAFRRGDEQTGDRLFVDLYAEFLEPDLRRRLRFFAWSPQVREEAWSRVIDQVYVRMLRRGKPVERRWLAVIYRRCTYDELGAVARHATRAQAIGADDDLESLLGRSGSATSIEDDLIMRADVERLVALCEQELARPQWATVLRSMLDGHVRGSDIADATGMTQVRVRQVKMEIGRYLDGAGQGQLERSAT